MKLEDFLVRINLFLSVINDCRITDYISDSIFNEWVKSYNALVSDFNRTFNRTIPPFVVSRECFSESGRATNYSAVKFLNNTVSIFKNEIESLIQKQETNINHFHCFKIDHQCPHPIDSKKYLFFVGMPFDSQYVDSYQFGIKTMLDQHGIDTANRLFKADEQPSTIDILCKICKAIQESQYIIINISGRNPNVMFELGLAYGLNKTVFLIKDENSTEISDLKGLEYTCYSNATDLACKLQTRFHELGII